MFEFVVCIEFDYFSEIYKDVYSCINVIVIEGEQEVYSNYFQMVEFLLEDKEELICLVKMENCYKKGF